MKDLGRLVTIIEILDDDHQQVGDAELSFDNPKIAILEDIYIRRAHRGKSHNYGGALLKELLKEARQQGATILRCHPHPYERGLDEQRDAPKIFNCPNQIPKAKLIEWYVSQGFREIDQNSDAFQQHCFRLCITL